MKIPEATEFVRSVLLVDDDEQSLYLSRTILKKEGFENVFTLADSREVCPFLKEQDVAIIVLDLAMPFLTGQELLAIIAKEHPAVGIIIMSSSDEMDTVIECMKNGAIDYLIKPVKPARLLSSLRKGLEMCALREEACKLKKSLLEDGLQDEAAFRGIITINKKMLSIFKYIEAIATSREPVLITGETGTGKELIARAIHDASGRKGQFVTVNVAGLDDTLFSDTLFGHRKGAFSGADSDRTGLIARAASGTLFLDEIGDLQELSQVKLLRLLQEKVYYPLGSDSLTPTDSRLVCATNKNLQKLIAENKFRKDFYYRLLAHKIHIPPLRERKNDIPSLLDHFLSQAAKGLNKKKPVPPPELFNLLSTYHFPGNIRELRAMVYDAVSCHRSGKLSLKNFKTIIGNQLMTESATMDPQPDHIISMRYSDGRFPTLKDCERQLIREALREAKGNQSIAAGLLGISRQALNRRIRKQPALLENLPTPQQ